MIHIENYPKKNTSAWTCLLLSQEKRFNFEKPKNKFFLDSFYFNKQWLTCIWIWNSSYFFFKTWFPSVFHKFLRSQLRQFSVPYRKFSQESFEKKILSKSKLFSHWFFYMKFSKGSKHLNMYFYSKKSGFVTNLEKNLFDIKYFYLYKFEEEWLKN